MNRHIPEKDERTRKGFFQYLIYNEACPEALRWVKAHNFSLLEAWRYCPNPCWMLWLLTSMDEDEYSYYAREVENNIAAPQGIGSGSSASYMKSSKLKAYCNKLRKLVPNPLDWANDPYVINWSKR